MTASTTRPTVSRRTVLAGLGAGGLGLALAGSGRQAAAQDATPGALQVDSAVVYGTVDGQSLLLDVGSPPARASLRPAVILIHPGGLTGGDRSIMTGLVGPLAEAGYVTFNIEYRLFSEADGTNRWPAQLDDVQRAVRWIRINAPTYEVDPERIGAVGTSSGGHLAAFLGTRDTRDNSDATLAAASSRVACVVDVAGPTDLTIPLLDPALNATIAALLGGTAGAPPDQAAYRDLSPVAFVDAKTSPFVILQGGADEVLTLDQSRGMEATLHKAGVEVIYGEFPGFTHRSIFDWTVIGPETLAFLGRHLHPQA
jgi:acetyl esterase/lipase